MREKAIAHTRAELPHALYVRLEDLEMSDDGERLRRGVSSSSNGNRRRASWSAGRASKIRAIVARGRAGASGIFPYAVKLDLRVKVDREWRKKDPLLKSMLR